MKWFNLKFSPSICYLQYKQQELKFKSFGVGSMDENPIIDWALYITSKKYKFDILIKLVWLSNFEVKTIYLTSRYLTSHLFV